jgi:hypothetical protein
MISDNDLVDSDAQAPPKPVVVTSRRQIRSDRNEVPVPRMRSREVDEEGADQQEQFEDGEYEEGRPRRRRGRRRRKQTSNLGALEAIFSPFLIGIVVALGLWGVAIAVKLAGVHAFGYIALGIAILIAVAGHLWFLQIAFSEDSTVGYMCIYIPFYSLYYTLTNLEETWKPMATQFLGGTLVLISFCAGALSDAGDSDSWRDDHYYENRVSDDSEEPDEEPGMPNKSRPSISKPPRKRNRAPERPQFEHQCGVRPMRPSARRWNSSASFVANSSTERQVRCQSSSRTLAAAGAEQASTYAFAFGSVPLGRRAMRA